MLRSHIGWPSPQLTDTAEAHGSPVRRGRDPGDQGDPGPARPTRRSGCPTRCSTSTASRSPAARPSASRLGRSASRPGTATGPPGTPRRPATACPGWADDLPTLRGRRRKLATRHGHQPVHRRHRRPAARAPGRVGRPDRQQRREGQGRRDPVAARRPAGRQIHYGIREHGMGAVMNGMAAHGGVLPVGGTFFVFSDYMRPSVRLAALTEVPRHLLVDPRLGRARARTARPTSRSSTWPRCGPCPASASSGRPTPTRRPRPGASPSRPTGRRRWC